MVKLLWTGPELHPHVIVLDIGMPLMNGLIAGERLKQAMPLVKLVYVTMNHDPEIAGEAFRLGASAYLLKNSTGSELLRAISEVVRGGFYITPLMTKGNGRFVCVEFQTNEKQKSLNYTAEGGPSTPG